MTLDVSLGTSTADSYMSVVDVIASLLKASVYAHGEFVALSSDEQDALCREITQFIDIRFGPEFPGTKVNGRTQALEFPRTGATDSNGYVVADDEIPVEIKRAFVAGIVMNLEDGVEFGTSQYTEQMVLKERIGPISSEYATDKDGDPIPVDLGKALKPYLGSLLNTRSVTGIVV